jgi:hypothetical protein
VIQINLNHCEAAQDLLFQAMSESKCEVALISEPFRVPTNNLNWVCDKANMAALHVSGGYPFQEIISNGKEGFVIAKVSGVFICSCYAPPRWTIEEFERMLDNMSDALLGKSPIVIGGDLNAWAEEWNSRYTNVRGQSVLEALGKLNILTANQGDSSTFWFNGRQSIVDVTFCSPSLINDMNWRVDDAYTASDHYAIRYTIGRKQSSSSSRFRTGKGSRWKLEHLNKSLLEDSFGIMAAGDRTLSGPQLTKILSAACDVAMPRGSNSRSWRKPVYWWCDEIATLRANCLKLRRKAQRSRSEAERVARRELHKVARTELKSAIRASKRRCFKQLLEELNCNPWGEAYKIAMLKLRGAWTIREACPMKLKTIVDGLFPEHDPEPWPVSETTGDAGSTDESEVSVDELLETVRNLKANKVPGPDGIPNTAVKLVAESYPEVFCKTMQSCLEKCQFPDRWKRQKLVLIPKPGKAIGDPSSYRPICLLDTLGKLFEKIISQRLTSYTEGSNGLSNRQFGFRKGRSTVDAILTVTERVKIALSRVKGRNRYCAIITLDIKNAFNSASWGSIAAALKNLGIPENLLRLMANYFKNRILIYDTEDGQESREVSAGVPQGSISGSILWNVMYDAVLRLKLPHGVETVGFADDLVITVLGDSREDVELKAIRAIDTITRWMEEHRLEVAHQKTEMVLASNRKQVCSAQIEFGNNVTKSKRSIKYLGVMIDDRLNFNSHVDYVCSKAAKAQNTIARIMPNGFGPTSSKRRIIASVVTSILRYGCAVWADTALKTKTNRGKLNSVYRLSAIRVVCAYRTVSYDAVCVLASMLPIQMVLGEDMACYSSKRGTGNPDRDKHREKSLAEWQKAWDESEKGRWTYRLIPSISDWIERPWGDLGFHMTEFLSGHGLFREYLHKIRRADSPFCPVCVQKVETPEHVFFECPRFDEPRQELFTLVGSAVRVENLVSIMCREERLWVGVSRMVTTIMKELHAIWKQEHTQ